jgi:hypothetical protein
MTAENEPPKAPRRRFGQRPPRLEDVVAGKGGEAPAKPAPASKAAQGPTKPRRRPAEPKPATGPGLAERARPLAKAAGGVLGMLWAVLVGIVGRSARLARSVHSWLARHLTPGRVMSATTLAVLIALVASQFADYRGVGVGVPEYSQFGDTDIAPPPQLEVEETGSAHSFVMIPIAIVGLALLGAGLAGRWRLTRLISLLGIAVVVISYAVDRPKALDEGEVGLAYAGAEAMILDGFYAQLFAGIGLVGCGLLLAHHLSRDGRRRRRGTEPAA